MIKNIKFKLAKQRFKWLNKWYPFPMLNCLLNPFFYGHGGLREAIWLRRRELKKIFSYIINVENRLFLHKTLLFNSTMTKKNKKTKQISLEALHMEYLIWFSISKSDFPAVYKLGRIRSFQPSLNYNSYQNWNSTWRTIDNTW